jgi:acyl-CoA synthetase (AMP-forming)/AMP-acid ligase II
VSLTYNLADLWEYVCDHVADRVAVVAPERTVTFVELDERSNRLAHWLRANGVGPGDAVGLHLYNGTEYLEGMLAAYKVRAVPVNVNYRYVEEELRYLFDDAGLVALVHDVEFAPRVAAIRDSLPRLHSLLAVGEGGDYEAALAASPAHRPAIERSADDHYIIYTGGTTGMPKGVVWRQEDAFFSCFGGGDPLRQGPISSPDEIVTRIVPDQLAFLPIAPLMHGAAQWTVLSWLYGGCKIVLANARPRTDYSEVLRLIAEEKVNLVVVVGDAVARPFAEEYLAGIDKYDVSSLFTIGSGGALLSPAMKDQLAELFPHCYLADGFGASETGAQAGNLGDGRFRPYDDETVVLDEDTLEPVVAGSGQLGRVARRGHIPLRYHNDEAKTAATFVEADGHRWVLTGDLAEVLDDRTIRIHGRGSQCINTGGEKVFPEEVEAALRAHPDVYDAVVVGVPDERWGERVTAVVAPRPGATVTLDALDAHCRTYMAAYKVPRGLVVVDEVVRSPVGKPDYRWAKDVAVSTTAAG